jgi:hypothetical protein
MPSRSDSPALGAPFTMPPLTCDAAGFPVVTARVIGLRFTLLPVTKYQLEEYCVATGGFSNAWYEEVLCVSRRASPGEPGADLPDMLATGLLPEEAGRVARGLLPDGRLPTAEEWNRLDAWMRGLAPGPDAGLVDHLPLCVGPAARAMLSGLLRDRSRRTWASLALLFRGVGEWVVWRGGHGMMGRPPRTTWNPEHGVPVSCLDPAHRDRISGFRIVQSIPEETSGV